MAPSGVTFVLNLIKNPCVCCRATYGQPRQSLYVFVLCTSCEDRIIMVTVWNNILHFRHLMGNSM
jgi:hypothetical protein